MQTDTQKYKAWPISPLFNKLAAAAIFDSSKASRHGCLSFDDVGKLRKLWYAGGGH